MKNNANQTTSTIYYRPLKQWIDVTPEQKHDWERFVGTTRKAKQRAGACCIPYKKSYKCDGICDTCEFRCIPKDAPQKLSIDTEMENAYENGVSRTSFLADSKLTTEIDIDALIATGNLEEYIADDIHTALEQAGYKGKLSVSVDADIALAGSEEKSGIVMSELTEKFDRVYVKVTADQLESVAEAMKAYDVEFVPIVTEATDSGSYLIEK